LGQTGSYDPDGDGFGAAVESWRRYSPVLVDTVIDGGIASRRSAKLTFVASGNFAYTINSDPSGLVNQSGVVASGTLVTTPLAAETVSGNIFGYWRVNGVRQADSEGVAPRQVSFTVTGTTTVTAVYFPATADTDEDGVADWYEWRQFGSLGQTGSYDPDGDGFGAAVESWRRYSPVLVDTVIDGGIASRRSAKLTFVASDNYAYTINSDPSGLVNQSGVVASGTVVTTPLAAETVSGNTFGYWRVNGVRQADGTGVAPRQVSFTVAGATTVTAVYFPATADTDEDGVADWYEWRQFGSLGQTGSYDPDGDGFGAAVESWRRYSPVLVDTVIDGGIASRRSIRISYVPVVTSGFSAWAAEKFTSNELANVAVSGPNAVYGPDGLPNLIKYALGLDPKIVALNGLPEATTTATLWVYTYTRPADRADLVYAVEISTNLTSWTTNGVTHERVASAGGMETWQATCALSSAVNIFFRLKVTQ
ncbi:MAG: hypothetical protein KA257_02055, partial [Opitutaceae bacterium]|nr:hypothetical protein [Opitutaceae bacterium]